MKVSSCFVVLFLMVPIVTLPATSAFVPVHPAYRRSTTSQLHEVATKVEVCSNKDCKRGGGGPRLEKAINTILAEKGIETTNVELCDCQGECGYGPNLVVDGKIINRVKGREAIVKALGIDEE